MWSRKSKVNTTSSVSTLPLWPLAKILSKVKCIMQVSRETLSLFSPTTCTKWGGKLWYLIIFTLIVEPSRTWLSWKEERSGIPRKCEAALTAGGAFYCPLMAQQSDEERSPLLVDEGWWSWLQTFCHLVIHQHGCTDLWRFSGLRLNTATHSASSQGALN